jgi:hypothetical protein
MSFVLTWPTLDSFKIYGNRNYRYVEKVVETIRSSKDNISGHPGLRKDYDKKVGVFPCRSFNLGDQSASYPHVDEKNLAQSWCSVTALGPFKADLGGHFVLWDLALYIRFPPGSTILIPSALLLHSNTTIQPGEERHSIVQYVAGGLARWVDYGQMSVADWHAKATVEEVEQKDLERKGRWENAVRMYTSIKELSNSKSVV